MKRLSETLKELGIDFVFPIVIKDADSNVTYYENIWGSEGYWSKREYDDNGNETYREASGGYWSKSEYDANGKRTYSENCYGYWSKCEYDSNGNVTYFEASNGYKKGTPRIQLCAGKVIEVDGKKYKLTEL